jgi:hypothetical protein
MINSQSIKVTGFRAIALSLKSQSDATMSGDYKTSATTITACIITIIGFLIFSQSVNIQSTEPPTNALTPSLTLLGAGARWTANGGNRALYVNWIDYSTDNPGNPAVYNPPPNATEIVSSVMTALSDNGLTVDRSSEIPGDLSIYSVVVIDCYWAGNPYDSQTLSNYIFNGGGVVLISGTPPYFVKYDKTLHPLQNDLFAIEDWLGASSYYNVLGQATISVNNPFGTVLRLNQTVFTGAWSQAAVFDLRPGATPVAVWAGGGVFAYTYEYGRGRVYFQASHDLEP